VCRRELQCGDRLREDRRGRRRQEERVDEKGQKE
jgi:hypothetical protein